MNLLNQVLQGLLLGGYYAVLACGLSFMFGVMRIINLAHGSLAVVAAYLLWWLAERRTRVLAVMTTNKRAKLPPELYREGRIDDVMYFHGLEKSQAFEFAKRVAATFKGVKIDAPKLGAAVTQVFKNALSTDPPTVSHAAVTKAVTSLVKEALG